MGLNPLKDLSPDISLGLFLLNFVIKFIFRIFTGMKKYMFILIVSVIFALTSCGSESTTTIETTDSTAVSVDTLSTTVKDTTVEVKADSSDVK